ncbi:uncharacterized protein LOC131937119 [Physella acuta]|uniref:uncharacterized protein LOC131937119 n=1 Tax=Physella acuta TaxID=109671 RepID=UPI0027DB633A|nr:uncharacterized protein LOC131937119 [Physella acuta]
MIVSIPISFVVSFFGVFANVLNLIIFLNQKNKDSISVGLVALSFSDLWLELISLGSAVIKSMEALELFPTELVDLPSLIYVAVTAPCSFFYDVSAGTVVLISLEKCVCVFSPFRAKRLITQKRMLVAIGVV